MVIVVLTYDAVRNFSCYKDCSDHIIGRLRPVTRHSFLTTTPDSTEENDLDFLPPCLPISQTETTTTHSWTPIYYSQRM